MKECLTAYKAWAPPGALWTQWAKPVLFSMRPPIMSPLPQMELLPGAPMPDGRTMLVVDLPGAEGVVQGLNLARVGYRPVPLYNGVAGDGDKSSLVPVSAIVSALFKGAQLLESLPLQPDAPPAFLLDGNRMHTRSTQPGMYDNCWCVFAQDMPSARFVQRQGIGRVVVCASYVRNDLAHVLWPYQRAGIEICRLAEGRLTTLQSVKPSAVRALIYRAQTIAGLKRNAAGGFGAPIPEPVQSGSGHRYYGHG